MDFNEKRLHETTLNLYTDAWIFPSLSIASIDDKQHLNELVFSALVGFSLQGKWRVLGFILTSRIHRTCCTPQTVTPTSRTPYSLVMSPGCTVTTRNPSFSLQWKSNESTKHYLSQVLLVINWRYWQEGKISRMQIRVQGVLMQARFIEIHQVFAKKKGLLLF